jgi:hypothetical protein
MYCYNTNTKHMVSKLPVSESESKGSNIQGQKLDRYTPPSYLDGLFHEARVTLGDARICTQSAVTRTMQFVK